jgi:hypothetical protein
LARSISKLQTSITYTDNTALTARMSAKNLSTLVRSITSHKVKVRSQIFLISVMINRTDSPRSCISAISPTHATINMSKSQIWRRLKDINSSYGKRRDRELPSKAKSFT